MQKNKQLSEMNSVGQSIWYDNLSKDVLASGELKSLIEQGVSGLTSNPTIFKKSIADSTDYDADIQALAAKGLSTDDLTEDLMIQDVGKAADLLKPIYESSKGNDGYASIEVSPFLARDTKATTDAAKRIWTKLKRPNIMVKIPGTKESLPSITAALEAGINVNVTLIFSQQAYEEVAEAYIAGLEAHAAKGGDVSKLASVASFFVSRVDAICEKSFAELVKANKAKPEDLKLFFGKVGIANSKLAYESFEKIFGGERFKKLEKKGARVQRPLWASTGTKNPDLSPVLYCEELVGRDTVNTMPPATLKALLSGGTIGPRLHAGLAEAKEVIATVKKLGIPFDALMVDLQTQGVKSFEDSFRELLDSAEQKKKAVSKSK